MSMKFEHREDGSIYQIDEKSRVEKEISNFKPVIERHIEEVCPGGVKKQKVEMSILTKEGEKLGPVILPATDLLDTKWVTEHFGFEWKVVGNKNDFTKAVGELNEGVKKDSIYVTTGFKRIDGVLHFTTNESVLSAASDGRVKCSLPGNLKNYSLPPSKKEGKKTTSAINNLLAVSSANSVLALVLIAAVIRAVLGDALRPDFTVFLVGRTGSFKSSIAAAIQAFFGGNFNKDTLPAHWSSTSLALGKILTMLNHVVCVIDDFKYKNQNQQQKVNDDLDQVLRGVSNSSPRLTKPDLDAGKTQVEYAVLPIVTAETVPIGADPSLHARVVYLDIQPGDLDTPECKQVYQDAENGVFAQMLSNFIQYYIDNEDEVKKRFVSGVDKYALEIESTCDIEHKRVISNFAQLLASYAAFLRYQIAIKSLKKEQAKEQFFKGKKLIIDLATRQHEIISTKSVQNAISEAFETAIKEGEVYFGDVSEPDIDSRQEVTHGWRDRDSGITYVNEKFDPTLIAPYVLKEVKASVPDTKQKFWIKMKALGMLAQTDSGRNTVRKKIHDEKRTVYPAHLMLR